MTIDLFYFAVVSSHALVHRGMCPSLQVLSVEEGSFWRGGYGGGGSGGVGGAGVGGAGVGGGGDEIFRVRDWEVGSKFGSQLQSSLVNAEGWRSWYDQQTLWDNSPFQITKLRFLSVSELFSLRQIAQKQPKGGKIYIGSVSFPAGLALLFQDYREGRHPGGRVCPTSEAEGESGRSLVKTSLTDILPTRPHLPVAHWGINS